MRRKQRREVDRCHVSFVQHPTFWVIEAKQTAEINSWCGATKIISDPTAPVKEVGIVAGEPDQTEHVLHDGLLHHIHKGSKLSGVRPKVVLSKDEIAD